MRRIIFGSNQSYNVAAKSGNISNFVFFWWIHLKFTLQYLVSLSLTLFSILFVFSQTVHQIHWLHMPLEYHIWLCVWHTFYLLNKLWKLRCINNYYYKQSSFITTELFFLRNYFYCKQNYFVLDLLPSLACKQGRY